MDTPHANLFERFHASLMGLSQQLKDISPDLFEKRAKELYLREVTPQVQEIKDTLSKFALSGLAAGACCLSTIGMAFITSGMALPLIPVIAFSLVPFLNSIEKAHDYFIKKDSPAYIWSKLQKN